VRRKGDWDVDALFLSRDGGYPDIAYVWCKRGDEEWGCFFLNGCNSDDQCINYPPLGDPVPIVHSDTL
jgi:hypothetical protein